MADWDFGAASGPDHPPSFAKTWIWVLLYAVVVIGIGLFALFNPVATGVATGVFLGLMLLIYGFAAMASGLSALNRRARWIELLLGLLAVIIGCLTIFNPFAGAVSLIWMIGAWLMVAGVFETISAVRVHHDRAWRLMLGILNLILGAILLFSGPSNGLLFLAVVVGIHFVARGIFLAILAFGLRRLAGPTTGA